MARTEHGTRSGYQRCRRRPEGACTACRRANSEYMAQWRKDSQEAGLRTQIRAMRRLAERHPAEFRALVWEELRRDEEAAA